METKAINRVTLDEMELSIGKKTRLHRLLYKYGPANGTLLLLPIDQGLEHGPRDFIENPDSANPDFQLRIAKEGGYSGIVFHYGIASKYMKQFAGTVPLVLKINGKTEIPSDAEAFSPLTGTVEDAVRLGADAIGYTLYVGSPAQSEDFLQFVQVREEADRYGIPIIVWAYPRGEAIQAKGGRDSLYAIEYAARVAAELGADVIKLNEPNFKTNDKIPEPYRSLEISEDEALKMIVRAAGKSMVLFAGGSKLGDEDLVNKANRVMNAGATGLIFGRNIWQRKFDDAITITARIKEMMKQHGA